MSGAARSGSAEIVVIGGGVEGCSIAYHLAKSGARVTLVERWEIAAAASGASAGGVRHQQRDLREFPLAFRAIDRWPTLEDELGADVAYRRRGHLTTIEHEADLASLTASTDAQIAAGLDIRVVQGAEMHELAPNISRTIIAAAYTASDGHANPTLTTRAFADAAIRYGATVIAGRAVTAIQMHAGHVIGVKTDEGSIAADVVVLAAGAWSAGLAKTIGLTLPLTPFGFQAMTTEPATHSLDQVITSVRRLISLKQLPDGRYLLGGGWHGEFTLNSPRGSTFAANRIGNLEAAIGVCPPVGEVDLDDAWLGIEAVADDEVPIIGPIEGVDGLIVAAGFSGHGFALAPAVGEAVAELILTGQLPASLTDLTFARFQHGKPESQYPAQRVG